MRRQPAASSCGFGIKYKPLGEPANWYKADVFVLAMAASIVPSIKPCIAAFCPPTSTRTTSDQSRSPKARTPSIFIFKAGAPITHTTRLPARSCTVFTPVSLVAAATTTPVSDHDIMIRRSFWGPQRRVPKSLAPSCARKLPIPVAANWTLSARNGVRREISFFAGITRRR